MARTTRSSTRAAAAAASSAKEPPKKKRTKAKVDVPKKKKTEVVEDVEESVPSEGMKVVTVESCKSWGAFRTRSTKIQKGVGSKATVEINKEKPGKGNFVVKVEGVEEPIVELLSMKRPFPALKALDMDEVIEKILKAIEG